MIKKFSVFMILVILSLSLCACGGNVKLFETKSVSTIYISDKTTRVIVEDANKIDEFVDKFYRVNIATDYLAEQENGDVYVGEKELQVELIGTNKKEYTFDFVHYRRDEDSELEYYFQKQLRERYYLSAKLTDEEVDYFRHLFYGDVIILD